MYCCSWSCFSLVHLRITANLLKLDWRKVELCWPIRVFLQNIKSRTQNQSKYIGGVAYDEEEKGRGSFLDEGCSSNIVNKKIVHNFFFCFFFNIKCLFPILSLFVLFLPLPFVNFFFEFDDWKKEKKITSNWNENIFVAKCKQSLFGFSGKSFSKFIIKLKRNILEINKRNLPLLVKFYRSKAQYENVTNLRETNFSEITDSW